MTARLPADWLAAFLGGALLAYMLSCNALLAKHSTPLFASWAAHGLGAAAALLLVSMRPLFSRPSAAAGPASGTAPRWAFLGGLPGALTVVLAGITINSRLGLPGTVSLALVGQVVFGFASDAFGLFGAPKRRFGAADLAAALLILAGSALIIFGKDPR